jgi:cell division septum initiation protein DivIVA
MDILHLVDRLEQLLNESRHIPMTSSLILDEDRVYNLVDQMRVTIPEEVKRASRIMAEKDRVLAQANEEADRIRELARAEAEELVKRDAIVQAARQKADGIQERALREADALRDDADAYVINVLSKLEDDLLRSLSVVRNGLRKLNAEQQHPAAAASAPPPAEPVREEA